MNKTFVMDKTLIASLEELLDFTEPDSLRRSLQQVYFNFLLHNKDCLPANFNTITEDVYFMIQFLDRVEGHRKTNMYRGAVRA